ncbi:hypothetical protein Tlie_0821 [Thermovirga lienii DSM 17291]|jgi:hypothetical protein|uniref:Uncharacterized protein n=1 Tax=Thermovirga lienii (strain ATCC BAA-1197 / DSM 17291 / Cas60314) TaxID=580340 RepID=G7V9K4_THELD|nr:hypothetical protein Tlie_0821 [Thermovirga lienii DSM 17291]KUK43106.1 MAG: Uncharacterized protein XD70_0081 [Thermovirga lienii]MDN5318488.1 hypothetical protein [Thermovirga sp.]MDN5368161.1 hypothetical protein [Thermovirga sp.]
MVANKLEISASAREKLKKMGDEAYVIVRRIGAG